MFGHGPEALNAARIQRDFVTAHNGMRTVVWEQELDDLKVFETMLIAHTTKNEELISLSSRLVPALEQAANAGAGLPANRHVPAIDARRAVANAAANLDEPDAAPARTSAQDRGVRPGRKRRDNRRLVIVGR